MVTKRQEHNAQVLENELAKLRWVYNSQGQVSWHIMETPWKDRYRCLTCLKHKFNLDFFNVSFLWQFVQEGKVYKEITKLGRVCSPKCCDETTIRYNESDKIEDAMGVMGFDAKEGIKIHYQSNPKKHYVCKGCRKRKSITEPFMTIGYQHHDPDDGPEDKSYTYFFGRVCSEECYNLMVFKMMQK